MLPALLLLACAGPVDDTAWDRGANPHALDDVLRLDHVQVKGTHNSYHLEPDAPFDDSHRYSQPTLTAQLAEHHVRQLELDVHLRSDGGWSVLHIPGIDAESTCPDLADCLAEIKAWSDANGWHLPLVIWLEPKDDIDHLVEGLEPIGDALLDLDDAITAVWPRERLFTPDDLRGAHPTLPDALAADGWPTLGALRGRAIFALLDASAHRDTYVASSERLEGRVMFVDTSRPDDPFAALVKDGSPDEITAWAAAGFVITDNGSSATDDDATAEALDHAALAAGVHQLATDLPAPVDGRGYWLDLAPRCNPVTAPPACDPAELEDL